MIVQRSSNLAKPEDMYFTCIVERGSVSMAVNIVVSADYPTASSLMVLALKWQSVLHTGLNDEDIRVTNYILMYSTLIANTGHILIFIKSD